MMSEPEKGHRWLQRLVGEWTWEYDVPGEPGQPPHKHKGTEKVRSVGGLWVLLEGEGYEADGTTSTTIMTLGYDPKRQRFIGTWIGSMMGHLWLYEGQLDASEQSLPLESEGPDMSGVEGKMARYRDTIELVSEDHRRLRSETMGEDGAWQQFMVTDYRRVP
jgi:Protein of unknown function (DUF1579)